MMMRKTNVILLSLLASATLMACGGDDDGTAAGDESTYQGLIAFDSGENGTININVPASAESSRTRAQVVDTTPITGECIFPGGTVPLEGAIDSTGAFTLSGDGYTFTGTLASDGTFTGTLTLDDVETGSFGGVESTTETVKTFCGTFEDEDTGVFLVVVAGDTITGSYSGTAGRGNLTGTVDGDNFTVTSGEGGYASGTISGDSVSGTIFHDDGTETGTLEGTTSGCST